MNCINPNSPEYQEILKEVGNPLTANEVYRERYLKNGVEELFESNLELAKIGTQQQYSQYLDTIFPDSKVKDIVYHGSEEDFKKFEKEFLGKNTNANSAKLGFFFSNNIENSKEYIGLKLNKARNLLENHKKDMFENSGDSLQERYDLQDLTDFEEKERNSTSSKLNLYNNLKEQIDNISQELYYMKDDLDTQEEIVKYIKYPETNNTVNDYSSFSLEEAEIDLENAKNFYNKHSKPLIEKLENLKNKLNNINFIYKVFLNIKNPEIIQEDKTAKNTAFEFTKPIREALKNNKDGVIIKDTKDPLDTDIFVVFEPEQIHILGSKQDIEGFKNFIINPPKKSIEGKEELLKIARNNFSEEEASIIENQLNGDENFTDISNFTC